MAKSKCCYRLAKGTGGPEIETRIRILNSKYAAGSAERLNERVDDLIIIIDKAQSIQRSRPESITYAPVLKIK